MHSVCFECGGLAICLFNITQCQNEKCKNYRQTPEPEPLARVCWKVNGRDGHSSWMRLSEAEKRAKKGLLLYGKGTHWVERKGADKYTWHYDTN